MRPDLLECSRACLCLRSPVRRHIAHASSVLSMPVTVVKIPIMRLIFVSVERPRGNGAAEARGEAVMVVGSVRLWLVYSVVIGMLLTHLGDQDLCPRGAHKVLGMLICSKSAVFQISSEKREDNLQFIRVLYLQRRAPARPPSPQWLILAGMQSCCCAFPGCTRWWLCVSCLSLAKIPAQLKLIQTIHQEANL